MPRWPPLHPELEEAIAVLDALGMPYAELWRLLRPISRRLGVRQPTYWMVRRRAIAERRRKLQRARVVAEIYGDMVTGRLPYRLR
ncbi:MAG: hypothetical protein ICV74_07775 [Thermoleophilia bacterium]|nr:hypothetical protein [Thermoleophilia bacterium]